MPSALILMAGLPGSGKSTIAWGLAKRLDIGVLATDVVEAALRRVGYQPNSTGAASYLAVEALADAQLSLGHSVIIDAVNPVEPARQMWRSLASRQQAPLYIIECVCEDQSIHRTRVEGRVRAIQGLDEISWEHVQRRRANYEAWQDRRLVLRTDLFGPDELIQRALAYVAEAPDQDRLESDIPE